MDDSMRREFYWPHMVSNVHNTVSDCYSFAVNRSTAKRQRKLHLFAQMKPLERVTIDIYESLSKTNAGSQFIVVMVDKFLMLTKATSTPE